ncbi:MAG: energy transducer TonB [Bacteroidales bacterium]|nr:energy transducer TonB [Bacteroidales bacterium]
MKQYLNERKERERNAVVSGLVLTVVLHICVILLVSFNGLTYLYPPPQETSMLIDFDQSEEIIQEIVRGKEPRSEEVDLSRPVELVQRSESPVAQVKENLTPATKPDAFGDVETPEPERKEEPKLDPRATFPGMAKKDTSITAEHSANDQSLSYKAGQPAGNTSKGSTDDKPNAHLEGRSVDKAGLKRPVYNIQESGTVVVSIWVDQYGNVQKATPGAAGTTVTNKTLWAAARNAAMETHFTQSADAPALQEGTITYVFKLK